MRVDLACVLLFLLPYRDVHVVDPPSTSLPLALLAVRARRSLDLGYRGGVVHRDPRRFHDLVVGRRPRALVAPSFLVTAVRARVAADPPAVG